MILHRVVGLGRILNQDLTRYHSNRSGLFDLWRTAMINPGLNAVARYRIAHFLFVERVPFLPRVLAAQNVRCWGFDVPPGVVVGSGLLVRHPVGIVISHNSVIGKDCTVLQGVTLGERMRTAGGAGAPIVGDEVVLGAHCVVLGEVRIGSRSSVGANSVVLNDVAAGSTVAGAPARTIQQSRPIP